MYCIVHMYIAVGGLLSITRLRDFLYVCTYVVMYTYVVNGFNYDMYK